MGHEGCKATITVYGKKDNNLVGIYQCPGGEDCFWKKILAATSKGTKNAPAVEVVGGKLAGIKANRADARFIGTCFLKTSSVYPE